MVPAVRVAAFSFAIVLAMRVDGSLVGAVVSELQHLLEDDASRRAGGRRIIEVDLIANKDEEVVQIVVVVGIHFA